MTLNDVVSFARAHNEANGEVSGDPGEISANYGAEGPDPALKRLRLRQIENHLTILMLSQGVPMLLAGDECRRTQRGNNNPYLQDNEISWFDWTLVAREAGLIEFVRRLLDFRQRHPELRRDSFFTGEVGETGLRDIAWHGCDLDRPGFGDLASRVLSFTIARSASGEDIHAILNMDDQRLSFELPQIAGRRWVKGDRYLARLLVRRAVSRDRTGGDDATLGRGRPDRSGPRIAVKGRSAPGP